MGLRAFRLPADLPILTDLIPPAFQYPENPEWSIAPDEVESFVDSMNGIRRIWPLIRVAQWVAPPLRDVLRGFIWEEDGKAVGLTNIMRQGNTNRWYIGNVAVLPEYRRRGIARQLVQACMDYARERGATRIGLDVVAGNMPAYTLYEKLGYEHYTGQVELICESEVVIADAVPMPAGYSVDPVPPMTWQPRYDLMKRILPPAVQKYAPAEEGAFRQPRVLRYLAPIITNAMGNKVQPYVARRASDSAVVATCSTTIRLRAGGVNEISLALDPAHAVMAPYLVRRLLHEVRAASPDRRVESVVPQWQSPVIAAMVEAGFRQKLEHHTMGISL
jgi:GNAT superfamily N-acetyltransferase